MADAVIEAGNTYVLIIGILYTKTGTFQIPVDSSNEIFGGSTVVSPNKLSTTFASF